MLSEIKRAAGQVSEDYLLKDINMTDSIESMARKDNLNEEVIKRICELANQNTYLSIFNSSPEKRGNVQFTTADSDAILKRIKEKSM